MAQENGPALPDFWNPLDWVKAAQDWFSKTERSSGFRPYLIFMLLSFGAGLAILAFFASRPFLELVGAVLVLLPAAGFIPLFAWKAHKDPDFCRSESHVQKIFKYELEMMGSESRQIEGEVLEREQALVDEPPKSLPSAGKDDDK